MQDAQLASSASGPVVLQLSGEYDLLRREELEAQLSQAQFADIAILDMREVSYIDSTALTELVRLKKRMAQHGAGIVRLVAPQPNVQKIFALTQLEQIFPIFKTLGEAMYETGPADPDV